jgi:hypothetical protein
LSVNEPLLIVKVTVYIPATWNAWLGFWAVPVVPSSKLHRHALGAPEDLSVNRTVSPVTGDAGLNVNDASSAPAGFSVSVEQVEQTAITRKAISKPASRRRTEADRSITFLSS